MVDPRDLKVLSLRSFGGVQPTKTGHGKALSSGLRSLAYPKQEESLRFGCLVVKRPDP